MFNLTRLKSTVESGFWHKYNDLDRLVSEIYANTDTLRNYQDPAVIREDVIKLSMLEKGLFLAFFVGLTLSMFAFIFELTSFCLYIHYFA